MSYAFSDIMRTGTFAKVCTVVLCWRAEVKISLAFNTCNDSQMIWWNMKQLWKTFLNNWVSSLCADMDELYRGHSPRLKWNQSTCIFILYFVKEAWFYSVKTCRFCMITVYMMLISRYKRKLKENSPFHFYVVSLPFRQPILIMLYIILALFLIYIYIFSF